jgi:CHASE3 domain sensor protein
VEIVLFSWLIMSLYARIFESFELPAICFLLLFHCSYYTIKSNEKEAENPAFTRDFRHDTG